MADKKPRRPRGEGGITKRKDGKFIATLDRGMKRNAAGKLMRDRVTRVCDTYRAAQLKLAQLRREHADGQDVAPERMTFEQFLQRWMDDVVKLRSRPNTVDTYVRQIRLYLVPAFGARHLSQITAPDIQAWISRLRRSGKSANTIKGVYQRLDSALQQAVAWGLIPRNPADGATLPRGERFEAQALDEQQAARFLDAARGDRLEALYVTALGLGLRRGEVLGLQWSDIDFPNQRLRIVRSSNVLYGREGGNRAMGEPKTPRSRRVLPMPDVVYDALVDHQTRQKEEAAHRGVPWDSAGFVFVNTAGEPYNPKSVHRPFKRLLKRAGLSPDVRFHDLRHSCASLMAARGVHQRVAMEIMGHSSIATTQQIYTHVFERSRDEAAALLNEALGGGKERLKKR